MPNYQISSSASHKLWQLLLLALLVAFLTLAPKTSWAQTVSNRQPKASVVVDGTAIFQIAGVAKYTADERADIINQAIRNEQRSPQPIKLEVVQINQQIAIRSKISERHLLTVTSTDVISTANTLTLAIIWKGKLEAALRRGQIERTPAYLRQASLLTLVVTFSGIFLHVGLQLLGKIASRRLLLVMSNPAFWLHPWQQRVRLMLQLTLLSMQGSLWLAISYYVTDILPHLRSWRYQLFDSLNSPIFRLGESEYSAIALLLLFACTIGLWIAIKALTELFKAYVLSKTGVDARAQDVVAVITQYVVTFLSLIVLWQIWGLDVGSLAILASVLGVGIGFGLQNITNDFISGLIITVERPIQLGDFINVGELVGTVQKIGARSTEIRTLDQVSIIVPNSRFLVNEVINWTHNDPISRLRIPVGVAYGSDVEKVKLALLEAARTHPDVLIRPRPQVWFREFGDSSLNFDLLVWTGEPKKQFLLKSDINYRIHQSFQRYGVEIPFPQRDLHLRSPQLEQLIAALLQQSGVEANTHSVTTETTQPNLSGITTVPNLEAISLTERLTAVDIEEIVAAMQGDGGVDSKDRRYRLNFYPACFIGCEAVDWLMEKYGWTRAEAIEFGQLLLERKIIHHVSQARQFEDGYYFYRFA